MIIYAINVNRAEACSFYRSHGPLAELHKLDNSIQTRFLDRFNLLECKGCDVVVFQRPTDADHLAQIKQIKKLGIPLIVDYDDNMLQIPSHNPFHRLQELQRNDYKSTVKVACLLANQIWVTTKQLKEDLSIFNDNIKIIPNAFDDYLYRPNATCNKTKTILWRGSQHHEQDLLTFKEELTALIKNNPTFNFVFLGEAFPQWIIELSTKVKNMGQHPFVNVYEYPYLIQGLTPVLTLVPLEDSSFNRSKSDINLLEAVIAGSNVISPDFPEWTWNTLNYKTGKQFLKKTQEAIDMIKKERTKILDDHWQNLLSYVLKNRRLSEINRLRLATLKKLIY